AEKQSVWLTRMPSPLRCLTAFRPSLVSGHFTTTFGATCASSLPSLTMPSKSVATTSRLTSPGTIEQISSTSGRNGRFSFAISDGFVVHPSTRPIATPSRSSVTLAVSRKIFMASSCIVAGPRGASRALDLDRGAGADFREDGRVADDAPEDVDRAGRADLLTVARRRWSEEDAKRRARRPVAEIAHFHRLLRRLGLR